ncbi:Nuclear transcription factor Y subunit B-6 [Bienertia sinuspersici]
MPVVNVVRIMRQALPSHAKVADESKEMMQECVSEFINFITSEANESCQLEHHKTITAEDVIGAMSRLGFDHYVQPLSMYLQKHRENEMYPSIPRRSVGNMGTEATAVTPTTNVLPPSPMLHPQFPVFRAGNERTQ